MPFSELVKNVSNSINSNQSPEETAFFDLFLGHYETGRGRPEQSDRRYTRWPAREFLDAMQRAGGAPSNETLSHWLARENVPLPPAKDAFLQVFFPGVGIDARDKTDQEELHAAWEAAWYKRRVAPRKRHEASKPDPVAEWEDRPGYEFRGLVEFRLENPVASNEDPDIFWLPATLWFGIATPVLEGVQITVALEAARLEIPETSYRVANGMLIGDTGRLRHDHFVRRAGESEVIAPKRNRAHLDGPVLGEPTTIATIRPAVRGRGPLTAHIVASPVEIDVEVSPETAGPPSYDMNNKNAVLKALMLENYRQDDHGRIVLARRCMERKADA
jgi:hypothetical protein